MWYKCRSNRHLRKKNATAKKWNCLIVKNAPNNSGMLWNLCISTSACRRELPIWGSSDTLLLSRNSLIVLEWRLLSPESICLYKYLFFTLCYHIKFQTLLVYFQLRRINWGAKMFHFYQILMAQGNDWTQLQYLSWALQLGWYLV